MSWWMIGLALLQIPRAIWDPAQEGNPRWKLPHYVQCLLGASLCLLPAEPWQQMFILPAILCLHYLQDAVARLWWFDRRFAVVQALCFGILLFLPLSVLGLFPDLVAGSAFVLALLPLGAWLDMRDDHSPAQEDRWDDLDDWQANHDVYGN